MEAAGLASPVVHVGLISMNNPGDLAPGRLGRELADRGFESLWMGEHSHIPASRCTPFPGAGDLPVRYLAMMDPFLSLLAAAIAAPDLVVGTSVALPLEHDLFDLAKTVATLDHLTEGRFQFGVGVGWNVEELADHRPIPWSARYRALGECVAALKVLWTEDEAEFHGEFFDFPPAWCFPKPLQRPHPTILCGMAGKLGTREALAWADVWMPIDIALGNVERKLERFRSSAHEAGRDPAEIPVTLVASGDPGEGTLAAYRDLGAERVIIAPDHKIWDEPSALLHWLDGYVETISALRNP
jgi:probable F420-dependent oxidoreductase